MIRLKNTSKIEQTIALAPTAELGVDVVVVQRVGPGAIRKIPKRLGDSIRLQPGATSRELPDSAAKDPTIAQLIQRGIVAPVKI